VGDMELDILTEHMQTADFLCYSPHTQFPND